MEVNVHDAKTYLSELLRRVENGEEITISRAGERVAKLIAAQPETKTRPMGMDRGKIWMADDFDHPDPKLETLFHGPVTTETAKPSSAQKKKKA
jgi:prevent-host-death family protein